MCAFASFSLVHKEWSVPCLRHKSHFFILLLFLFVFLDVAVISLFISCLLLGHMLCAFCPFLVLPTSPFSAYLFFLFMNCDYLLSLPLICCKFHLFLSLASFLLFLLFNLTFLISTFPFCLSWAIFSLFPPLCSSVSLAVCDFLFHY